MGGRESARVWGVRGFMCEHVCTCHIIHLPKSPGWLPLHAGSRLNSLTWPMSPCVSVPPPGLCTHCTLYLLHSPLSSPVTVHVLHSHPVFLKPPPYTAPDGPHPGQLSLKPALGHHRFISWVCTCPAVTLGSLSGLPTRNGASSGEDRIC